MRVGAYVDGFNLYYGGRSLCGRGTPGWRWLDVRALIARRLGWDGAGYDERELNLVSEWLYSKCYSIYGGSHEIQNNITAKHVLNLPD